MLNRDKGANSRVERKLKARLKTKCDASNIRTYDLCEFFTPRIHLAEQSISCLKYCLGLYLSNIFGAPDDHVKNGKKSIWTKLILGLSPCASFFIRREYLPFGFADLLVAAHRP